MTQPSQNIGGQLGMHELGLLFGERSNNATQHRPQSRPEFAREALRLTRQGLTPQDIASLLQRTRAGVRELLEGQQ